MNKIIKFITAEKIVLYKQVNLNRDFVYYYIMASIIFLVHDKTHLTINILIFGFPIVLFMQLMIRMFIFLFLSRKRKKFKKYLDLTNTETSAHYHKYLRELNIDIIDTTSIYYQYIEIKKEFKIIERFLLNNNTEFKKIQRKKNLIVLLNNC